MFIENAKHAQLRAKFPPSLSAEKRKPSLGKLKNLLLAGTASLMFLSSCGKEDAPPRAEILQQTKRAEHMLLNFDPSKYLPVPLMEIQQRKGFCIAYENDSVKTNAERLAIEIEKYQSLLPKKSQVGLAIISNDFGDSTFNDDIVSLQVQKNWIYARGNAPAFSSETRLEWSVFHEMAHLYMDYSLDSASLLSLEKSYLSIMRLSNFPAYQDNVPPLKVDRHPLLGLFDESTHLKGAKPVYGHPEEGEWELFASTSTVLRFSHKGFFARLGKLGARKRTRAFYTAAFDFARLTVTLWGGILVFPDEVYAKLNLPLPGIKLSSGLKYTYPKVA